MGEPVATAPARRLDAWAHFLRAHAVIVRELSADLVRVHGLTINDYEVLLFLARAPDQRLRRVDLAQSVVVTASGITRILQGLERDGLVRSEPCAADRRVTYARLTEDGLARFEAARKTHLEGVERLFLERIDDAERRPFERVLRRLVS